MSSVPTTSSAPVTPSAPAAAASADDSLRRSKRRKFTLDVVAAAHGNNQKRRKRDYGEVADSDDDAYDDLDDSEAGGGAYAEQLNVETGGGAGSDGRRRSRRSTAVFHGYQQDTYDNWVEMSGPFACHKCPSRYESKSSLANHAKMHTKERKEFKCELCCFSSQTLKSLTWHNNVHKQFGVLSPQISPVTTAGAIPAPDAASAGSPASDSSDSAPAPEAQNTSMDSSTSTASLVAPDLSVEPLPEAPEGHDADGDEAAPLLDAENPEDEEDEDDGPPVLEREDEQREVDQEREVSESPDHLAVRKSGRTSKPTQKKLEEKKPRKYTKQQQKTLPILDALPPVLDDTTASGRLQEDTPSPRGSLPTTSAPSSVTPPPVVQKQTPPVVQKETSKRGVPCSKCPYTCSSVTRLQRHFRGHTLDEGYICPEPECHFMCRKRGFIAKHYILHSKPLLGQPKFCRKVINKKNGKVTIEEVEDPNHPSTGEEPEDLDTSVEDVTMEEEEAPPKLEVEEKPKKRKYEKKSPEQKRLEKEKKEQKELKKLNKMKASEKMPELQIEKVEEESEDVPEEKMPLIPLTSKARVGLIAKAQIKSHKTRIIDGVPHKQCNIGECDFLTTSITQLIVHKTNKHGAKKAFPFHRFLCSTCGYRTTNFGALRAHKMTNHLTAPNRFHRTFYLKEAIGDKFYIKYFTGIGATPPPPPLLVLDDSQPSSSNAVAVTAPMKFPHVPVVAPTMRQMLFFAQQDEDVDDEPFDSIFRPEALANLTPEEFAALKMVEFCCNVCPYRAPSMNRCQRHYAKHFTNDPIKCKMCSWTARGEEVMKAHEEMHRVDLAEKAAKLAAEQHAMKTDEEKAKHVEHEEFKQTDLFKSIHKWCLAEKAKRPELGEPFTRKMIDSIKGFACTDCPYTSKYRGDMRSHKKRHDIEQSFRCVQCTYTTNRPVSLKDHMKQHLVVNNSLANGSGATHPIVVNQGIPIGTRRGFGKDRIYNCSRCPYTTVSIGCLWRHARYHRRVPKHSICSNCTYSSLDTKKIEEHILVHLAMGGPTEQIPFVKRVDHHGRPVSSLTDLNGGPDNKAGERKVQKRKLEKAEKQEKQEVKVPEEDPESLEDEDEEDDEDEVPRSSSKRPSRYNKVKNEDKEFRIYNSPAQKRRRTSVEPSPDPEPTRQLSERVSRNKINYSLLSKNGSGKATPSSSSSNLMRLAEMEEDDEGMEDGEATNVVKPMEEDEDPMDIGHWKIRNLLRDEFGVDAPIKCPDCPFESPDAKILENHRFFHSPNGPTRPFVCSECTFNTITPTALIQHLKVHNDGNDEDMRHAKNPRLQKHQRKGDTIPHGVKGYSCTSCSFKTTTEHKLKEHTAIHRVHLINRIRVSMKRQPPKAEYQRPKMKHLMVAKNAKHCKKCTFKCVTQSVFIEHLDRHGWNQLYKCKICDYSDACKSVVDFHQMHHHSVKDQTLRGIIQATKIRIEHGHIQNPENADAAPTPEEIVKRSGSIIKCPLCEYVSHEGSQLAFHMTVEHLNEPNAEETISFLSMGIMPPRTTVVAV